MRLFKPIKPSIKEPLRVFKM